MTENKKTAITLGIIDFMTDFKIENSGDSSKTDETFYVPNLYAASPLGTDNFAFGIGAYSPYGLGVEWDEDGITRYSVTRAQLNTIYITPAAAWKPIPQLSLGLGVSYITADVELEQKFPFSVITSSPTDAKVKMEADDQTWGWTAGIIYKPVDSLNLGFSYRSKSTLKFNGDMEVKDISANAQALGASSGSTYETDVSAEFPLPERYSFGIAYNIWPEWVVEFDYELIRWSVFENLEYNLKDENAFFFDTKVDKDWKDSHEFKLGTEMTVIDNLALRCGTFYLRKAVPDETLDPLVPDGNRYGFTLGIGYSIWNFNIGLGYMGVFQEDREVENDELEANNDILKAAALTPGKDRYEGDSHLIGLNLTYSL